MGKEYVDELLVKLGLETDAKAFKEANEQFTGLKTRALAFGAVVAGVAYGTKRLTDAFAAQTDKQGKFAAVYGTSAQFIDALGFALEKSGGQAVDAFASIKRIRDLLEETKWGEISSEAFKVAGFDPYLLRGVTDVAEAYERIAAAAASMQSNDRRVALQALGFSDAEITLFANGKDQMLAYFKEAARLAPVTQEMVENAARYNDSQAQLSKAVEGLEDIFANRVSSGWAQASEDLAEFLTNNRPVVERAYEAVIAGTADEFSWIMDFLGRFTSGSTPPPPKDSDPGGALLRALGIQDTELGKRLQARNEDQAAYQKSLNDMLGFSSGAQLVPSPPSQKSGDTIYDIRVDARGSQDPVRTALEVERAVRKVLNDEAQNLSDGIDQGGFK